MYSEKIWEQFFHNLKRNEKTKTDLVIDNSWEIRPARGGLFDSFVFSGMAQPRRSGHSAFFWFLGQKVFAVPENIRIFAPSMALGLDGAQGHRRTCWTTEASCFTFTWEPGKFSSTVIKRLRNGFTPRCVAFLHVHTRVFFLESSSEWGFWASCFFCFECETN